MCDWGGGPNGITNYVRPPQHDLRKGETMKTKGLTKKKLTKKTATKKSK